MILLLLLIICTVFKYMMYFIKHRYSILLFEMRKPNQVKITIIIICLSSIFPCSMGQILHKCNCLTGHPSAYKQETYWFGKGKNPLTKDSPKATIFGGRGVRQWGNSHRLYSLLTIYTNNQIRFLDLVLIQYGVFFHYRMKNASKKMFQT